MREDRLHAAWHLAVSIGMRRGELLGLRWQDLDRGGRAAVRQTLALDRDTVAVLRGCKAAQDAERLTAGPARVDSGPRLR